jgi:hypothetical protein
MRKETIQKNIIKLTWSWFLLFQVKRTEEPKKILKIVTNKELKKT